MIVEKYYTVQQIAWLLEFDRKTIAEWARAGCFGPNVVNIEGKDVRVPASGVQAFLLNHQTGAGLAGRGTEPVAARSAGELRRKVLVHG